MPEVAASAILSFNFFSSTTINLHGWELQAEGAILAASIHFIIFSLSTSFEENFLQLNLFKTRE